MVREGFNQEVTCKGGCFEGFTGSFPVGQSGARHSRWRAEAVHRQVEHGRVCPIGYGSC